MGATDRALESLVDKKRNPAAVVDMGMGENHRFQSIGIMAKAILVPIGIATLK
jgi:hypothetical protein